MKKLELNQMEVIEGGGGWGCLLAGVGTVLGGAGIILSGGAAAPIVLGVAGMMAGTLSACEAYL